MNFLKSFKYSIKFYELTDVDLIKLKLHPSVEIGQIIDADFANGILLNSPLFMSSKIFDSKYLKMLCIRQYLSLNYSFLFLSGILLCKVIVLILIKLNSHDQDEKRFFITLFSYFLSKLCIWNKLKLHIGLPPLFFIKYH